jgi:hypothetical protein
MSHTFNLGNAPLVWLVFKAPQSRLLGSCAEESGLDMSAHAPSVTAPKLGCQARSPAAQALSHLPALYNDSGVVSGGVLLATLQHEQHQNEGEIGSGASVSVGLLLGVTSLCRKNAKLPKRAPSLCAALTAPT